MTAIRTFLTAVAALPLIGCGNTHPIQVSVGPTDAQLFAGMGSHGRSVTTTSAEAQRYFDQAMTWMFAFNHDEAIRSFRRAAELDPDCAMAFWGEALCHGPHINNPVVPDERSAAAWSALEKARALSARARPVERALIEALSARYANPWPADRAALDQAYAEAMAEVWAAYPDDADVGVLYAESLMDLQPWNLYTQQGEPREGTDEIVALLEHVRSMAPDHPGAAHLLIHAVEPGRHPERAMAAADLLRDLVPASGHLLHMPSHIDVLVGSWEAAIEQNRKAIRADALYRALAPPQDFQHGYMSHNSHMLVFAAMMSGREKEALAAARALWRDVPEEKLRAGAGYLDYLMCSVYDVQKRFGRWDAILAEEPPPDYLPITVAMWRHARAIAFAAKKDFDGAEREHAAFRVAVDAMPEDQPFVLDPARKVLQIADHLVVGEIALQRGDLERAAAELRKGVAIEDTLLYMEPPQWIQPMRHTLGAVLLEMGHAAEAEAVYREDLRRWPDNGWSLSGLSRALDALDRPDEARVVEARHREAWAQADTPTDTSCKCIPQPGVEGSR